MDNNEKRIELLFIVIIVGLSSTQAAIVVYDLTNADTFSRAKTWVKELQRQASPNIVIALAGNKADLATKRAVDTAEAQVLPKTYNIEQNFTLFLFFIS